MADTTEYITVDGDRWDTIANKAYGDSMLMGKITEANRGIPLDTVFEAGITLQIPILPAQNLDVNLLPPWKR